MTDPIAALFAREPNRMVPGLERITALADLLGNPQLAFPSVHLTGTNGKTTTAAMVAALFGAMGITAGGYTSPHLQEVRERIRVAGRPIDDEALRDGLAYLDPFVAQVDEQFADRVSFFEVLTAAGFVHFADAPVDVGVIEVGLGGRWDATNLVRGEVAVLLPIALDHPELGPNVAAVASEKAGIIKPGATVVSAAQAPEAEDVIARAAAEAEAQVLMAGRDFGVTKRVPAVGGQLLTLRGVTAEFDEIHLPLFGAHQADNAAAALAAVEGFFGFAGGIDPEVVRTGFAAVRSPGRLEVIHRPAGRDGRAEALATIVLDGAHNPHGATTLARALSEEFAFRHRIVVLGVLQDKDVEAIVAALASIADHVVATAPPSSRAAPSERIADAVRAGGGSVEVATDLADALLRAEGVATAGDAVVVTGSLHTVGAARTALGLDPE